MSLLSSKFVTTVFLISSYGVKAFVPNALPANVISPRTDEKTQVHGALHAIAPSFIIGPMIRKMKEAQEKKKMPMANKEEAQFEAPGLRVGKGSWKWPPVWPYDSTTFQPMADVEVSQQAEKQRALTNIASGGAVPQLADGLAIDGEVSENSFDPVKYWGEEMATATTDISEDAANNLRSHYKFYLKNGMSVLELGAAEQSYFPDSLELDRHVGVGLSQGMMDKNPSLTESYIVNLNDVEEERGVNSDVLKKLGSEPFDAIVMANTIDFLTNPREVLKSCWYLLKPGGTMILSFSNKDAYKKTFQQAQTKMWDRYTDDQHMWVTGSIFQFSAGDGWENLRGFDISPEDAKSVDEQGPLSFLQGGKNTNMFVVQADKAAEDDSINPEDPIKSFKSKMWMLPTMESRDKTLIAPRLKRAYEQIDNSEYLGEHVGYLPAVYESLIKMDSFAFTFDMQAQLAANLISDHDFNANEDQLISLKQGLGLRKPSKEFWEPVGRLTSAMDAEDKINLLTYLVPRFGSGDPAKDAALDAFVGGMTPTFTYLRGRFPSYPESDIQLLGTELLAAELLDQEITTPKKFATWVGAMSDEELVKILDNRKQIRQSAKNELDEFRTIQAETKRKEEEREQKQKAQLEKAREERTLDFDIKTGAFEVVDPNKKK